MPKIIAALVVAVLPILIRFLSGAGFLTMVALTGGIFLSFEGIFVVLLSRRANKQLSSPPMVVGPIPKFLIAAVLLTFSAAFVYEIIKIFI